MKSPCSCAARRGSGRAPSRRDQGFSVVELVIVFAIIATMIGISLWAFAPRRRATAADEAAVQLADFMRDASQRAISQRQSMRVRVDRANLEITLVDENGAAPDEVIRRERLLPPTIARIGVPATNVPPALSPPDNYTNAVFASDVWEARFLSNGTLVDTTATPAPVSATFHVWSPLGGDANANGPGSPQDVRVVTVFGPTAQARVWRHDGTSWVRR